MNKTHLKWGLWAALAAAAIYLVYEAGEGIEKGLEQNIGDIALLAGAGVLIFFL
jgi:hypothetical protein